MVKIDVDSLKRIQAGSYESDVDDLYMTGPLKIRELFSWAFDF